MDIETGEKPIRFRESVATTAQAILCGFEARELADPFGSGAFGTDGNVRVHVSGWFSAESARLGDGLGVYV